MTSADLPASFDLASLGERYRSGAMTPEAVIRAVYERIEGYGDPALWIHLLPLDQALSRAEALRNADPAGLPLYGVPFAIKDNIDLAGVPTTAACPEFAYFPERSAKVVERLCAAGAIPIGKTNLDQFATGLVGIRSPHGTPRNPFDREYLPGGSSSGSAVAVAVGLVGFALGTDTAGSGRVPAAFTNIVGLKPTRGLVSTRGVVPAVRSLDCVSVFALTCADAWTVLQVASSFDPEDPFSREAVSTRPSPDLPGLRIGVPEVGQLAFFGNSEAERLYRRAIERLAALGGQIVPVDLEAFLEVAQLLYDGPYVAERYAAVGDFLEQQPEAVHPVVREIICRGKGYDAVSAYRATYQLAELKRQTEAQWRSMDVLAIPTTGTIYTVAEVEADPIALNNNLGYYTNFVNLLDLCAISVPSGFQGNGLPAGVTFVAPPWQEALLCRLGAAFHSWLGATLGATATPLSTDSKHLPQSDGEALVQIAVVGAHLTGQPLNHQLTDLGGTLVRACRTAPHYRLYALSGGKVAKPGLIRTSEDGSAIELEVWRLSPEGFGRFVDQIPSPLGIGTLSLEDGEQVKGFLCETYAVTDATEITHLGGWRAYLAQVG